MRKSQVKITRMNSFLIKVEKLFYCLFFVLVFLMFDFLQTNAEITDGQIMLRGQIFYGNASWYGTIFHGRPTSSGEKYNKNRLTAAHNSFPFDTKVKVTNLKNDKSVIVRINDRGPHTKGRVIDLSEKAAKKIDLKNQGVGYVKIQVLKPGPDIFQDKKRKSFVRRLLS